MKIDRAHACVELTLRMFEGPGRRGQKSRVLEAELALIVLSPLSGRQDSIVLLLDAVLPTKAHRDPQRSHRLQARPGSVQSTCEAFDFANLSIFLSLVMDDELVQGPHGGFSAPVLWKELIIVPASGARSADSYV